MYDVQGRGGEGSHIGGIQIAFCRPTRYNLLCQTYISNRDLDHGQISEQCVLTISVQHLQIFFYNIPGSQLKLIMVNKNNSNEKQHLPLA